jgi:hypothetical protein
LEPVGYANAGYLDAAHEEAVLLARAQAGGNAVFLTGVLADLLASAAGAGERATTTRCSSR